MGWEEGRSGPHQREQRLLTYRPSVRPTEIQEKVPGKEGRVKQRGD